MVQHFDWLAMRPYVLWITFYFGLLGVAPLTLLFMIKPLFSSPTNKRNTIILDREREPEFHAFVETIAESVGAPAPWRIEIDHLANASASYHRLPIDLFRRRMILTLGAR
jgi:hypothetical protein